MLVRMAEDEDRARRISELKAKHPKLTWAKIADEVGVSERAATRWQQTGALRPENAEALARLFGVDFDYLWVGPRPGTPELFVDRRRRQMNGEVGSELAQLRSEVAELRQERAEGIETIERYLERQDRILASIQALLERQDRVLERIEDAIARDVASTRQMDESRERLLAAAADASRVLRGETQSPARATSRRAK